MIVEDQLAVRTMLMHFFSKRGYAVYQADNGVQALRLYHSLGPQVIISDIKMPGMTGIELLHEIRRRNSDVIFILVTGFGTEEMILEALRKGASNFFRKPLQVQEVFDWLETRRKEEESLALEDEDQMEVEETHKSLRVKTKHFLILPMVKQITANLTGRFSKEEQRNIRIGLEEALTNAWEHGSLEITADEKSRSLENGDFDALLRNRIETRGERILQVEWNLDQTRMEIRLTDEGPGFAWRDLLGQESDLYLSHGRGLLLMKAFFDAVIFNEKGNQLILTKAFAPSRSHPAGGPASDEFVSDQVRPYLEDRFQITT